MTTTEHNDGEKAGRGGMKNFDDLDFTDNFMFCKVLENNPELCRQLARICTGESFGEIVAINREHMIEITPDGHGVRFDVCLETDNAICDIEMQVCNKGDLPKRSRYYQGMVDINTFERRSDYQSLKKSYIIFICMENPFKGKELHKYTFSNLCHENKNLALGDEAIKIFLTPDSTASDISGELEDFMNFVIKKRGNSDFTKGLEEAVEAIKKGEGWRPEYMHIQELYDEGREAGIAEGRKTGIAEGRKTGITEGMDSTLTIISLLDSGETDYKKIAESANVSSDIVEEIVKRRKSAK